MSDEGKQASIAALERSRAATQFGGERGNIPNHLPGGAGMKRNSVRHALRYLAGVPIDVKNGGKIVLPEQPTPSQLIAANALTKATKGDMRAVEYVTEQIDGKLIQGNVNAEFDPSKMSEEQLDEAIRQLQQALSEGDADGADARGGEAQAAESGAQQATPAAAGGEAQ